MSTLGEERTERTDEETVYGIPVIVINIHTGGPSAGGGSTSYTANGNGSAAFAPPAAPPRTTSRYHSLWLDIEGPGGGPFGWLALLIAVIAAAFALGWLYNQLFGGSGPPNASRVVTVQDFVKSRHINVSKPVPLHVFSHSSDGTTELQILRAKHIVYVNIPKGVQIIQKHSFRYKQLTATFTYNYRPLYSVPREVPVGTSYSNPRLNDPFAPHSGGKRISELIAHYNEMPLDLLMVKNLRTVTIRGI